MGVLSVVAIVHVNVELWQFLNVQIKAIGFDKFGLIFAFEIFEISQKLSLGSTEFTP